MGDLIDRAATIAQIKEDYCDWCDHTDLCKSCETYDCITTIEQHVPAVDAVPVIYSEWSWADGGKCKNCGFHNRNFDYDYCPMCGAKIRR